MKAKILSITRQDQTINVEVEYTNSVKGFSEKRVFNFDNVDWAVIEAEIKRVGETYAGVLSGMADLTDKVGTSITI